MIVLFSGRFPLIVVYAIALHLVWAVCLIVDSAAGWATAPAALLAWVPRPYAIVLLVAVAAMATLASFTLKISRNMSGLLMVPQQLILFLSAGGAMAAIYASQFADGVIRPRMFLIADQVPCVIAAVTHMVATLYVWVGKN